MKKLEKDLETKNMEKGALEARTTEAEKKVLELSSEVKNVCSSFYKSFIKVYAFIAIILNFYIFHCWHTALQSIIPFTFAKFCIWFNYIYCVLVLIFIVFSCNALGILFNKIG